MSYCIPDAPYIREAERRGTDYMGEWYGFTEGSDDDEEEDYEA